MKNLPVIVCLVVAAMLFHATILHAQSRAWVFVTISNGAAQRTDTMGLAIGATDCIDPSLGEHELPPPPPAGVFDARFVEPECVPANQGLSLDFHNPLNLADSSFSYNMRVQKDTSLPILLTLSPGWTNVFASLEIYDGPSGGVGTFHVVLKTSPEQDTLTLAYPVTSQGTTTIHDVTAPTIMYALCPDCEITFDAPQLVTPPSGSNVVFDDVSVSWSASVYATGYRLQVATDSVFSPQATVDDESGLTSVSKDLLGILAVGRTYYWRVEAISGDVVSGWSPVAHFQTVYSTPYRELVGVTIKNGSQSITDSMGVAIGATDCLDYSLGEVSYPGPPSGLFQAWFVEPECLPGFGGISMDLHAGSLTRDTSGTQFEMYIIKDTSSPIVLQLAHGWQSLFDSLVIQDAATGGGHLNVDMHAQSRDTLTLGYVDSAGYNDVKDMYFYWRSRRLVLGVPATKKPSLPNHFGLSQNYPNPFNPTTTISFEVERTAMTTIEVYNILGQRIASLISRQLNPGNYTARWSGTDDRGAPVSSGVYLVRMSAVPQNGAAFSQVRKLVLMK